MAQLTTTTVNGDLTVTGTLNLFEEITIPGGKITESLVIRNDLHVEKNLYANNLTNSTGEEGINLVTSGDNLYHTVAGTSYKILDANNYVPPPVDSELSDTSVNAVQNKTITASISGINSEISVIKTAIDSVKDNYLKLEGGHLTGDVTSDANITAKVGTFSKENSTALNITGGDYYTGDVPAEIDPTNAAVKVTGGMYVTNGIGASKIFNAVWNDIADFVEVPDNFKIEYGKAYTRNKLGDIVLANNNTSLGIASDTYGFGVGNKEGKNQMPIAIGGWVLAYVDKLYYPMTPLKAGENGCLTELLDTDPAYLCLGLFDRVESNEEWNGIKVNGRCWVKVK